MIKRILSFAIAVVVISSCGTKTGKNISEADKAMDVQFTSLVENPGNYIDKDIKIEGKVVHVCPHTGKKMFIVGENPDIMLYVTAGENSPKFPMELQGTTISVEGRLARAVTAERPAEEPMKMGAATCPDSTSNFETNSSDSSKKTAAECETEKALSNQPALTDLMMIYNKHTLVK